MRDFARASGPHRIGRQGDNGQRLTFERQELDRVPASALVHGHNRAEITCDQTMLHLDYTMDPQMLSSLISSAFSSHAVSGPAKCQLQEPQELIEDQDGAPLPPEQQP